MAIIGFLVFGLVVGAVARLHQARQAEPQLLMTLLLGVVGSLIGGVVASRSAPAASSSSTSSARSSRSSPPSC